MAGGAAAWEGGLESCHCTSGHRGELPDPTAAAFLEQELDAPLTGEEPVQACGAPGSGRTLGLCHFRLPSSLEWKRKGRRAGQPVADAFGTSWRGHTCFREPRFPGGRTLGNGGLGLEVLLGKQRRRRPRRPPLLARGSREAGRPSGDAARSRARGRRGGAVARGCRLVPAAVGLVPSPATEGAPAGPPQRRLRSGQRDSNTGAFE